MSASALYEGWVRHRRLEPVRHDFRYRLFMAYLDLAELPELLDRVPLWSARRPAPAWFRRADYLSDEDLRSALRRQTGESVEGPVRVLTHVRTFGHLFNPVSLYYCFDRDGEQVHVVPAVLGDAVGGDLEHLFGGVDPDDGPGGADLVLQQR